MILYVNGDSHSAGAEAINSHCFAEDDTTYSEMKRKPHPDNLAVSYSQKLADFYSATLVCDAESGSSNARILRTTYNYLKDHTPDLIVIGWATWEREEVIVDGEIYQFSAGLLTDQFSDNVKKVYKEWIVNRQQVQEYSDFAQQGIWKLHQYLTNKQIKHIFFNTYSGLTPSIQYDWAGCYLRPYEHSQTYFQLLTAHGYKPVEPGSYHLGPDAHYCWAEILHNHLTNSSDESIIAT
jgi:hypothetical protein